MKQSGTSKTSLGCISHSIISTVHSYADVTNIVDWNTKVLFIWLSLESKGKQYTIWDLRIPREQYDLYVHKKSIEKSEYPVELAHGEAVTKMTAYFNWEHMPLVGFNYKVYTQQRIG